MSTIDAVGIVFLLLMVVFWVVMIIGNIQDGRRQQEQRRARLWYRPVNDSFLGVLGREISRLQEAHDLSDAAIVYRRARGNFWWAASWSAGDPQSLADILAVVSSQMRGQMREGVRP